ncbi:helix-turn-helix domain-containing protein [Undibacterium sp. KW1]|uniref:helix-turn-helix domain-containing protein n=1 Tax=Undibacterium sp. KW1 TaxID=2058624 RepID=UPI001331F2F7|nr:RodZ domain-containing protein [Undibacterium sp. KW1]BBB60481.1 helix-turn-helix domain-containing protein [Undibacterium sp. KW1]
MSDAGANLPVEPLASEISETKAVLSVVQTAGSQLSAARVQLGLSVQQVADQLKLSQRQILALESNQFDDLPKMVIVRGFVRSYAKLLKLDPAPVIDCLPAEKGLSGLDADLRPTLATPFMESRTPFLGRQDSNNNRKYVIGAIVLAACALIFVAVQKLEQNDYIKSLISGQSAKKTTEAEPEKPVENPGAASIKPEADKPAASTIPTVLGTLNGAKPEAQDIVPPPKVDQDVQTPVSAPAVAQQASALASAPVVAVAPAPVSVPVAVAAPAVADAGNNQLKLKFRQDSWIQVKRENGSIVTSHLAKAGTEEVFDMKEALQLRIGNAAGVDGWLRGKSMEIAPGKDSNVINLNVK